MMQKLIYAFRNVFRNRKRSILTGTAILTAAMVVVLMQGFIGGMLGMLLSTTIKVQTAHIRITTDGYLTRERFLPVDEVMSTEGGWIDKLRTVKGVKSVEERNRFGILLGKGDKTLSAMGMGLPLSTTGLELKDKMIQPVKAIDETGIQLGEGLASNLGIKMGDEILLAAQTSEGGLNGIKLKVTGIFQYSIAYMDDKFFFVSLENSKKLLKLDQYTTEVYIYADDISKVPDVMKEIRQFLPPGAVARDYKEQLGSMYLLISSGEIIYYFLEAIVLFLASFVVINTMMMSVFERLREIGTLKAMGMTDGDIFLNFTLEGMFIGAMGGFAGALLGYVALLLLAREGLVFREVFKGIDYAMEYVLKPTANPAYFFLTWFMAAVIPALASMVPARYARRLVPAEALRKI